MKRMIQNIHIIFLCVLYRLQLVDIVRSMIRFAWIDQAHELTMGSSFDFALIPLGLDVRTSWRPSTSFGRFVCGIHPSPIMITPHRGP